MDLLEKIDMFIGEGAGDGKSFPVKKKKDDTDSEESAEDKKGFADGKEDPDAEGEDPYDPETDLDKEKKQKALKKQANLYMYTPAYKAGS